MLRKTVYMQLKPTIFLVFAIIPPYYNESRLVDILMPPPESIEIVLLVSSFVYSWLREQNLSAEYRVNG